MREARPSSSAGREQQLEPQRCGPAPQQQQTQEATQRVSLHYGAAQLDAFLEAVYGGSKSQARVVWGGTTVRIPGSRLAQAGMRSAPPLPPPHQRRR
jgi:hypothetical protein